MTTVDQSFNSNKSSSFKDFNAGLTLDFFVENVKKEPVEHHMNCCLIDFVYNEMCGLNLQEMYRVIKVHFMIKAYLQDKKLLEEKAKHNEEGLLDFELVIDYERYNNEKPEIIEDFLKYNHFELEEVLNPKFEPGDLIKEAYRCFLYEKVLDYFEKKSKPSKMFIKELNSFRDSTVFECGNPEEVAWRFAVHKYKLEEKRWGSE